MASALGKKPEITTMIDDGYWQGAPVGGFGAGTRRAATEEILSVGTLKREFINMKPCPPISSVFS